LLLFEKNVNVLKQLLQTLLELVEGMCLNLSRNRNRKQLALLLQGEKEKAKESVKPSQNNIQS